MAKRCPKCQADNPDTSSFCAECGTQLGLPKDVLVPTKTLETPFPQFSPGKLLANRYEIIRELGRGGMGEVYLAEDKNLRRQVAIKVLPRPFALDREREVRFQREARLLASLNHPNIATIHGLEKADGQQFLVMELVEGDTLADRILKGPLPLDETFEVCRQIAEGLESAHEKGIIHRDLKPSNVKVTPEGKVKILDFGLAKAFQQEPEAADLANSPTLTDQMTRPGVILGTAAYMSPEQARNRSVDKRTDIWAFGCVLYECLTGKPVLQGDTVSDTLALILKGEPDWTKLPANTPHAIKVLLRRCLQKDPRKRLHDIADARIEMEDIGTTIPEETTITRRFPLAWVLGIAAVGIVVGFLIGITAGKSGGIKLSPSPIASVIKLDSGHWLDGLRMGNEWPSRTAMAISKDGRFIVYCAVSDDSGPEAKSQLFMRHLDRLESMPIPGTEGGIAPFLSPDDRWIGFWRDGKFWKVSVEGGLPQELCEGAVATRASWGDDDSIVFALGRLYRVSAQGGKPEGLAEPDPEQKELAYRAPFLLPNGKGVLFTIMKNQWDLEPRVAVLESGTGERREVLEDASDARYVPTGHLVFLRRGTLMAVAFNLEKLEPVGQPMPIIPDVMHSMNAVNGLANSAAGQYSISDSGSLVYVPGSIVPNEKNLLVWVDQEGNETPISSQSKAYLAPCLSPDGKKITYFTTGTDWSIWVYDIDRDIHRQIVSERIGWYPIWTPDGSRIVFTWRPDSFPPAIYAVPADGGTAIERLITSQGAWACSFSADGNLLAFLGPPHATDIFIHDFRNDTATPFAADSGSSYAYPEFSRDGRWIAYCSDEDGHMEVYVRPSSGTGKKTKISREGGIDPV